MPTPRETILQALLAALQVVPDAIVLRGAILPERIPSGGLLILRDGDPGTPEVTLSPLQYHYEHRAEIEVIVQGKTPADRDAAFDILLAKLATAITTDRTLGGLCDWLRLIPQMGWMAWNVAASELLVWNGTAWVCSARKGARYASNSG